MTLTTCSPARERWSHAALLETPPLGSGRATIDAIVVPSARGAGQLDTATELARRLRTTLVVLCSDAGDAAAVAERAGARCDGATVVHVPPAYAHPLLRFATERHAEAGSASCPDLSLKRNLGLVLARQLGWRRVLCLDDDIEEVSATLVATAAAALAPDRRAIGFRVRRFPDNSVVCHARRLAGFEQDTFVGASALLVDVTGDLPFFPPVYNEDWLFLDAMLERSAVGRMGVARQSPYDPFDDPARAIGQEFGDVLAEGLLTLRGLRAIAARHERAYWRERLLARGEAIERTAARLEDVPAAESALRALAAAAERLASLTPGACTTFVAAWRSDLVSWSDRLARLPRAKAMDGALRALGLAVV